MQTLEGAEVPRQAAAGRPRQQLKAPPGARSLHNRLKVEPPAPLGRAQAVDASRRREHRPRRGVPRPCVRACDRGASGEEAAGDAAIQGTPPTSSTHPCWDAPPSVSQARGVFDEPRRDERPKRHQRVVYGLASVARKRPMGRLRNARTPRSRPLGGRSLGRDPQGLICAMSHGLARGA
jgi:hypothetical protein